MRKRKVLGALAALGAIYTLRAALKMASDTRRYNHMRSLSNEGTFQDDFRDLMMQVMDSERQTGREWVNFMKSAPKDLARYIRIGSM